LFAKVLRSYQTGGITYSDFLGHVNRYLAAGESPAELLKVLKRRQLIEPLPAHAHDALARLLSESTIASAEQINQAPGTSAPPVNTTATTPAAAKPLAAADSITASRPAARAGMNLREDAVPAPLAPPKPMIPPVSAAPTKQVAEPNGAETPGPVAARIPAPPTPPVKQVAESLLAEPLPAPLPKSAAPPKQQLYRPVVAEPLPVTAVKSAAVAAKPAATPVPAAATPTPVAPNVAAAPVVPAARPISAAPPAPVMPAAPPISAAPPAPVVPAATPNRVTAKRVEPEWPMSIPPAGTLQAPEHSPAVSAARPTKPEFLKSPWASDTRSPWKRSVLWLSAAAIAAVVGWIYSHPTETTHGGPVVGVVKITPAPITQQPPVAMAPPPPVSSVPGTLIRDCPTCPQMTVLRVGRFKQGSAYDDRVALPSEKPQHIVLMRQPFAMSTTELTVANFHEFVDATKRELRGCEVYDGEWHNKPDAYWNEPGFTQSAEQPVTCVSWKDAVAYADWLSKKTGHRYRLPSASEWEYAARSGSEASLPWGTTGQGACKNANVADRSAARRYPKWSVFACNDGYVNTAPVGSFKANAFGIDDMLGNVLEWTQDCWHDDYSKAPIDGSARMDGDCGEHELRGGSWFSSVAFVRPAYRNHAATDYRSSSIGVRLVREMTP